MNLQHSDKWRDAKNDPPKDDRLVVVYREAGRPDEDAPTHRFDFAKYISGRGWVVLDVEYWSGAVLLWIPLPELPERFKVENVSSHSA